MTGRWEEVAILELLRCDSGASIQVEVINRATDRNLVARVWKTKGDARQTQAEVANALGQLVADLLMKDSK